MGAVSTKEFEWSYTEEPHATRRNVILKEHPEIKNLFGTDESFKYVVFAMVLTQLLLCYLLKDQDWCLVLLEAYLCGGVMNHALTLAIHEIAHNLCFGHKHPLLNRVFGIFANLPIAVPMSISFRKYHLEHHRRMGEEGIDTDIPTELEGKLFRNTFTKCVWLLLQPLFYAFRPMIVYKKVPCDLEVVNAVIQLSFDYFVYEHFGAKSLVYLLFGTLISMGFHPTAGHFISEHYVTNPGQETYSYHGPLNMVTFNVGYHVEHHDFPYVSGDKLPLIHQIAPEYYDHFVHYDSWVWVLYNFLTNTTVGPYSRIKREMKAPGEHGAQHLLVPYVDGLFHQCGLVSVKKKLVEMAAIIAGACRFAVAPTTGPTSASELAFEKSS